MAVSDVRTVDQLKVAGGLQDEEEDEEAHGPDVVDRPLHKDIKEGG